MQKNKKVFFVFFLLVIAVSSAGIAEAQGLQYTLLEKIPGTDNVGSDLKAYLEAMYKVALVIVTLSAVLMLSIGGFMYLTSAGNTAYAGSAKKVIYDALIGLVIALVAWLVLYVINPDLATPRVPTLSSSSSTGTNLGSGDPTGPAPTPPLRSGTCTSPNTSLACCPAGLSIQCQACVNCVEVSGVTNKGCGLGKCFLDPTLLGKIKNIQGVDGWRITESWPPTVRHSSICHQNGKCADLNNSGGATDPATIKRYYDAFRAAGLNVLYESNNCTPYKAAGVDNCATYSTMTNQSSFHVQ